MRFVAVKTPQQQSVLVLLRMRTGFIEERTALVNRLRGLLVEFGVFLPQGICAFRSRFVAALEDATNSMTGAARLAMMQGWQQWQAPDQQIAWFDAQFEAQVRADYDAQRLMGMVGVGPLTACATTATVGDPRQFKSGRQFTAWLGLVQPRQKSSGGKARLGCITRQGNDYLCTRFCSKAHAWPFARLIVAMCDVPRYSRSDVSRYLR
ncbi:transposase [Caballeronia calidae]|uniref:Transposase n=2 Tax=Caballeronia calidae TaxID=1777139 RepID=A0A158EKJ0_9BURK|nr:transposase [Caballeronia calidae]